MGCQVGVETAKLTTVINTNDIVFNKSYDTSKRADS